MPHALPMNPAMLNGRKGSNKKEKTSRRTLCFSDFFCAEKPSRFQWVREGKN